jgi:HAD superfamily hydrolase (TIGR01509 family)
MPAASPPVIAPTLGALLWDVDGTLAETERDGHRCAFNRAFAEVGLPLQWDEATYGRWLAVSGGHERIRAALTELEGREPQLERVAALQACKQRHYAALVEAGELQLRPGVAGLIAAAAAAGLPQAIVTTSGRVAVRSLVDRLLPDLADAFAFWVCGEDVQRKKPDPQAYRRAAEQLQLDPQRLLVLEDSTAGLAAATGAGLACLLTVSHYGCALPLQCFATARAVVSGLGAEDRVLRGPACATAPGTLSYLQHLLAAAPAA